MTTIENKQGTIYYSIGTQLTSSNYSTAGSTEVPTGYDSSTNTYRNVGTYTIYYYIPSTSNYNEKTGSIDGVISKANAVNPKLTSYEGKYDGQAHTIKVEGGSGGTIKYRTSTSDDYSETLPTATNVGVTTVYVKVIGDANHNSSSEISAKITITAADFPDGSGSVTITGTNTWGQTLTANVINTENATLTYQWYSTDNTTATGGTAIANATRSTYTIDKSFVGKKIYVVVTAKKTNYNTAEWKDITDSNNKTAEVAKQDLSVTATPYNGSYNGIAHNATIKVNSVSWDGQTIVSGTSTSYGNTVTSEGVKATAYNLLPSKTDAGTYTIYYKVTGGHYYNDFASSTSITIKTVNLAKPTNIKISTAGIVTWNAVSNAVSYQISMDGTNYETAKSGVDYLSKITKTTGVRTVYVKAIGNNNYVTSSAGTASTIVYTVNFASNSATMGTVDTSSYNVINGTTYTNNSNKLLLSGITTGTTTKTLKTVTASPKSNYAFNSWSSNSGSISSNTTLTAYFRGADYTITLNNNGASTAGTSAIYQRYATGIYLGSAGSDTHLMTSTSNSISVPSKPTYIIEFSENGTIYAAEFSPKFNGYYTATSSGNQMINSSGYITSKFTNTYYTSNATLYAQWDHNYTLPKTSKAGYTCSWNTKTDGTGTKYNSGATASITADTTLYSVCTANTYKVTFNPNGGTVSTTSKSVTFGQKYGKDSTLPTPTRADSTDSKTGKTISYVFEGWYTAANGGTKVTDETLVNTASDHSIYAHWISKPIITGGSADWFKGHVAIGISTIKESVSDTSDVTYEYYISTSNESQIGGEWKNNGSANMISLTFSESGVRYIFFRAISSAGVYSDISNYQTLKIDADKPTLSVTGNPTSWVTTDIILKVSASDSTSGLKSVTANGKALSLNNGVTSYTVSANGTYTFVATDVAGNTTTQNVVVSKIDKVTPTAPVITGGSTTYSDTNDANGVKVYVKTAGTTGPSGVQKYEIEAHNFLTDVTPAFHKVISGFTISDKTYTTTNSDPYIRFDDFGPDGVYFNNVIIAFTQPTTKDISLRVYAWAKGSSPSAGQKISVTVPKGTNGWYYVPNFTAGTYDGLQFNFGGTAGDTYTINSFRYVNSTSSSKASDNYAYTESRRGQTGIYYRTVANNGLKSSWTTLDANSWAYISKVVAESNGFRYTTLQKAIDFATNNTATSIKMLKNVDESVSVASTKNIILNGNGFYNRSTSCNGLKNYGKLTINKMTFVSTTNSGVYSSGGTLIVNNTSDTNKDYYFSTETNGNNGLYISGGTVTVNDGYFASASKSCIVVNGGTLNFIHGNIQLPSIGKNAILFNNGIVNIGDNTSADPQKTNKLIIRGNEDENNCVSAIKMSDGNTGTLNVKRGYITGCIGINQEAKATGKINITGTATSIIAIHTGINLNSTTNNLLTVGTSGSTNTENPRIVANGDEYFAIQAPTSTVGFKMYSGRLVTNIASVYQGKNTATVSGKTFTTTKATNGKYYAIWK